MDKGKSKDYLIAACDLEDELYEMINWKGIRYLILAYDEYGDYPSLQICRLKSTAKKAKNDYLKDNKDGLQESLKEYYECKNEDWFSDFDSIEEIKEYYKDVRIKIIQLDFSNTICDETIGEELKKIKNEK